MEGGSGPSAKQQRRSHHKNLPDALCDCARCDGKIMQKNRTIEDHRTRYPRPAGSAQVDLHGGAGPSDVDFPNPPNPASPSLNPDQQLAGDVSEPQSPVFGGIDGEDDMDIDSPVRLQSPLAMDDIPLPALRANARRSESPIDADLDPEVLAAADELEREYRFDQLLNPEDNQRRPDQGDEEEGDGRGLGFGFGNGVNEVDDADFGLPDEEHQGAAAAAAAALPQFRLDNDVEPEDPEEGPDDGDAGEDPDALCAAFQEPDLIRNAYIDVLVQKILYGATHRALKHQLKTARRTISAHHEITPEHIAKMAQTIGTVERRLGVNTDDIITTFTLCPVCKRRYSPGYIRNTDNEHCLNNGCEGILFVVRNLASGGRHRVSNLTYPYASPISWLRHMLRQPGMAELMQTWRTNGDHELAAPVSSHEWMRELDHNKPLGDIMDGWGWRSTMAALHRVRDPNTRNVVDESEVNPPIRFRATKEGNYSVGACYLAINNLPRHMRFQRENISLTMIMPGPGEPNGYALDQMLDPLVDDLLKLKQGVRMLVRRGDPPVYEELLVHGELSQQIADLMARIKLGGGAGLKSELNFCLYCHSQLSSLSVIAGYSRQVFRARDTQEDLNNAYTWKDLPDHEARQQFFGATGNRFTALHRIPGWHTSTSSPLDAMHLLYLGGMNWIVKQVLVGPGMFSRRHEHGQDPQDIFNNCLDNMWMPKNFQRLPPKIGQTRTRTKADQWKLTARVLFVPLYLAFRDGDTIQPVLVPRGNRASPGLKHQVYRAKLLHQQRQKYYESIGQPDQCPGLAGCFPSRSLQFHYRQVLRFSVATSILDKRSITPTDIAFASGLLETLCKDYVTHNIQLPPNFHYMMHFEEFLLKTASTYNTHVWGMERANGIVSRIKHNGKTKGVLEGTLMRGWWSHMTLQNLIKSLHALPNRTPADESVIDDLLEALRSGNEQAQQRGTLAAFIAQCQTEYTKKYGVQVSTTLSKQSRYVHLDRLNLYDLVLQFCVVKWPNAGIFGPGMVQNHYLAPYEMVRNHSYVEFNGIRYGSHEHTSGKGYCYGYINGREAVRIERILAIDIPETEFRSVCVVVRLFQMPVIEPNFPWDTWAENLGVASWEHGELGDLVTVSVNQLSGTFALFDIPTTYGRYWVTVALDSIGLEQEANEEDE
ncbi:hypothetical protein FRC09_002003 [Ceratobasidium sp. 395]|nr:hypothetical protein FRC09_002003 [Ceratobasidium sp. 395]